MEKRATKKPFLKWAGSKTKLVECLRPYLPPSGHRYVEPFVGSGAVFLNANYSRSVLCDSNRDLINLYEVLRTKTALFIQACKALFTASNNSKARFYALRDEFNESQPGERRASLFIYLNRHCYNGLCRYNNVGQFNTPFGKYESPYFPEAEMLAFADKLQAAELKCQDFRTTFEQVRSGDVVYCDPPYVPLSDTANFTGYSTGGFAPKDQEALAALANKAAQKGAVVLVSNHDTPLTRELYRGAARTIPVLVQRMISCDGENRTKTKELIAIFCRDASNLPPEKWTGGAEVDPGGNMGDSPKQKKAHRQQIEWSQFT